MDSGASQSTSTSSSQEMCNILVDKEMHFCLVCEQGIDHVTNAPQHILEYAHKKNMKKLFEFCVQDPFCDSIDPRYSDVVNNSVLHISRALTVNEAVNNSLLDMSHILTNDSSYDKTFKCLLCTKTVSSAKYPDEIKRDLVLHLNVERDIHLDYMKRNFSWVYSQDNTYSFIMFHESIVYCSLCEEVLSYADNLMLHAAVGHLQTSQHRTELESMLISNNVTNNSELNATVDLESIDGLDKEFKLLNVTNNEMTNFKDNLFDVSGNSLLSSTNLTDELDTIVTDNLESNSTVDLESIDGLDKEFKLLEVTDNEMTNFKDNLSDVSGNNLLSSTNLRDELDTIVTDNLELNATVDLESIDGLDKKFMLLEVTCSEMTDFKDNLSDVSGSNLLSSTNLTHKLDTIVSDDLESIDGLDHELNSLEGTGNVILRIDENVPDVSSNDSEERDCEDLFEILEGDPLTCPECGETIEIYNNNADFSLRHHSQKHINLSTVNKSADCEYQHDTDYVCPVCMKTIPIFNKNLELSIARHFDENKHDQGFCSTELYNESEVLDNVLAKLPQEYQVHRTFFKLDGNQILCKLCSCFLQDSSNMSLACELITQHISDHYHSDQYKISSQQLTLTVVSYNKDTVSDPQIVLLQNSLFETLANKNIHVRNNKDFIEIQRYLYLCTICQKHICYSPNENILERNFLLHFNLSCHKNNYEKKREELDLQKSAASVQGKDAQLDSRLTSVFQNVLSKIAKDSRLKDVKYIEYNISGKFKCHICNVSMSASACGSPVKDHILGSKHKKQTKLKLDKEENERAQIILNNKIKFSKGDFMKKNLKHIVPVNGNFFCIFCKVSIIVTHNMSQLKEHLLSSNHKEKFQRDAQ